MERPTGGSRYTLEEGADLVVSFPAGARDLSIFIEASAYVAYRVVDPRKIMKFHRKIMKNQENFRNFIDKL